MISIASVDYSKLKREYLKGNISYRELAKKYDVSFSTLRKVAAKEHWSELRNNVSTKRDTELVNVLGVSTAQIDKKYFDLVDKLFDKAGEVIKDTAIWNVVTLKEMATAMKYLKECKGIKSDADMREQEARIRNLEKQVQDESPKDREINVNFEGDLSLYSK